jgi:uncharacterized membrane protein
MTKKLECQECSHLSIISLIIGIILIFVSGGSLIASIGFVIQNDNSHLWGFGAVISGLSLGIFLIMTSRGNGK